jgi:hypothetical protein
MRVDVALPLPPAASVMRLDNGFLSCFDEEGKSEHVVILPHGTNRPVLYWSKIISDEGL